MRHTALWLYSLLTTLIVFPVLADDWPQWRGPRRDGVSAEKDLAQQWSSNGPPVLWMARGLGSGFSSVSVVGNRIYTMGDSGEFCLVHALDAADKGKIVWSTRIGKPGGDQPRTRSTPTVDGDRVYALSQWGDLVCLDATNGKEVWRKNLTQDLGGELMSDWGYAESVLVDGENVICTPGGKHGTLAALNKKTGETVWRSKGVEDRAAYSSPIVVEIGGVRQYIQVTDKSLLGVAAADGKLLWRADRRGSTAVVPTPIFKDDHVFVTSGYFVGCNLFRISSDGGKFNAFQVYANKDLVNHHGGVVLNGDHLYGFSDSKGWVCMEFKTGKVLWSNRGVGRGSLTVVDGKLICRGDGERKPVDKSKASARSQGDGRATGATGRPSAIALVEASPDGYNELGRFDQPERSLKDAWAHPVAAGGRLYIRDMDGLLCYDLRRK